MKYLVVIDMQNDFITGSLGTEQAQMILPKVVSKVESYDGNVVFTKDTHMADYLETQEGRNLPVKHCMINEKGWNFGGQLESMVQESGWRVYEKHTFGSLELASDLQYENIKEPIEEIELCGLCTDICVISNALLLKAYMPEVSIYVDAACCAGATPQGHENALEVMKACQIIVKNQ